MNYLTFVLGDDFFFFFIAALIAGIFSGHSLARKIADPSIVQTDEMHFLFIKAAIIGLMSLFAFVDSQSVSQTIVSVTAPVGLYKVVQIFMALVFIWRTSNRLEQPVSQVDSTNG